MGQPSTEEGFIRWFKGLLSTILAALVVAAILGSVAAWNRTNEMAVRLDNYYIGLGSVTSQQTKVMDSMSEFRVSIARLTERVGTAELECKEMKQDLKRHNKGQ